MTLSTTASAPIAAVPSGLTAERIAPGRALLAAFVGPCLPLAALGLPLVVALPPFYASYVGLPLATVGAVFMVLRLLDIGFDPLIGAVMDATRTRVGRFRPWMLASAPILMLGSAMVFFVRPGASAVHLAVGLTVLYAGLSIAVVAQTAWAAILAPTYDGRSRVYTWWQVANVAGMVLVLTLPSLAALVVPGDSAVGVRAMGWFVIATIPLTFGLMTWRTPEPVPLAERDRKRPALSTYAALLRRPAVTRILGCGLLLSLAPGITGALFVFFFHDARGYSAAQSTLLLLIYFIGGLAGAPLWSRAALRFGKHRALMASCVYASVSQIAVLLLPRGVMGLAVPGMFMAGLAYAAPPIMLRAMTADAADEARLATGEDALGLLSALLNSVSKVGLALAVGIAYPLLEVFGFDARPGAHNGPGAVAGLEGLYVVAPVLVLLLSAVTMLGYRLDAERHGEIRRALAMRASAEALSP